MENAVQEGLPDEEANRMLDEILEEDGDDGHDADEAECTGPCAEESTETLCGCENLAENSSRFTLRVLEAMRRLQDDDDALIPTSSAGDIVDYVERNYRDDGDLYAQVRTVLKQVCSQGFVMELSRDKYNLIGAYAITVNQLTRKNGERDCLLATRTTRPKRRRRGDDYGDCGCDGRPRRRRRVSTNESRRSRRERDDADSNSSVILTDEDDCGCDGPADEERQQAANVLEVAEASRRNNGDKGTAGSNGQNEIIAQNVDDILAELGDRVSPRSSRRERELKEWIKRCQEECKRASRLNRNNN